MTPGLWIDFIVGSCIILIPLAILIMTIARGLDSKYDDITKKIDELVREYNQVADSQDVPPMDCDPKDLVEQDYEFMRDSDGKSRGPKDFEDGKIEGIVSNNCDASNGRALTIKKAISKRVTEQVVLAKKIKYFRFYSLLVYSLIIILFGLLPFLVYAGFNWRWK
jgi:hypothetical protein